jgi:N6-adenosine-specific RNA methylase IME4
MARPPIRKKGAFTGRERTRRWRQRLKRNNPDPKTVAKRARRAEREQALAAATLAASEALGVRLYGVIYADPPWRFEPYSTETGMDRAAENHYPTMALDEIKALAVPAAKDAVLFLWATAPMLPDALRVIEAWGFKYRSHFIWAKPKAGTGYWARNQHELLLIGARGQIPAPAPGEQFATIIAAADAGEHSEKPSCFREMIAEMYPTLPRLEMFARERFAGWDAWGNEVAEAANAERHGCVVG